MNRLAPRVRPDPVLVENSQRLINKTSQEPAAKTTFALEPWNVMKRRQDEILHRILGFLMTAEHAVRYTVKYSAIPQEECVKCIRVFLRDT